MNVPNLRSRIDFSSSTKKIKFISPEEIQLAIKIIVKNALSIEKENAATMVAKMLGFNRATDDIKNEIISEINHMVNAGALFNQGTQLRLNQ